MDINTNRDTILLGKNKPFLVDASLPPRSNLVLNSADYIYRTSAFNFVVNLDEPYNRARTFRTTKVCVPLPPNVNNNNRGVSMFVGLNTINFNLIVGYYNTTQLCASFNLSVLSALTLAGINTTTITMNFDQTNRCFNVFATNGVNIQFRNTCDFIVYGRNLCNFIGGSSATSTVINSGIANMIYCKYITINSDTLTKNTTMGLSRTTHPISSDTSIIAILDIDDIDYYMNSTVAYNEDLVPEATSVLLFNNKQTNKLQNDIDIYILDEFNKDYSLAFEGLSSVETNPRCLIFCQIEY